MARSKESFNKREKEKQRLKEKKEKMEKLRDRKANQVKGKSLDQMMAYVDENGNLSSTPPDPRKRTVIKVEDIQIGIQRLAEDENEFHEGQVDFFDEAKGFGFIIDNKGGKYFFHVNQLNERLHEKDRVSFQPERTAKGWSAADIKKIQQ